MNVLLKEHEYERRGTRMMIMIIFPKAKRKRFTLQDAQVELQATAASKR